MEITPEMRAAAKTYPCGNAERFPFHHLVGALELCEKGKRPSRSGRGMVKVKKIETLLSQKLLQELDGHSPFPILRLLLPVVDRERPIYSIKEKQLASLFGHALHLDPKSDEMHALRRFKNQSALPAGIKDAVGDFPMVLYFIVKPRQFKGKELTIKDVNDVLDSLSRHGLKGDDRKEIIYKNVYQKMNALEIKWFVRIVLKDLKIGVKHERVLDYLHADAKDMFTKCSDLRLVLATLRDPNVRFSVSLGVNQVFEPMLAKRADSFDVTRNTMKGGFYVEWKFDGERMLVHKKGNGIKLFTRNGNDYTSKYGPAIAPLVLECVRADDAILDCEVLVWDSERHAFSKFGTNMTTAKQARNKTGDGSCWMCLMIFDILYMKGPRGVGLSSSSTSSDTLPNVRGILTDLPLKTRRKYLETLVDPKEHHLEVSKAFLVQGTPEFRKQQIERWMDEVMRCSQEGIMIKDMNSPYICGGKSRSTRFWRKLKPEYADSLSDNLDLVILAGYFDEGKKSRRAGKISGFLLGVVSEHESTPGHPVFHTIGKVGTGYSYDELDQMREYLEPFAEVYNKNAATPSDTMWDGWRASKTDDIPDVWYRPDRSDHPKCPLVVEVKAAELTPTNQFTSHFTLRFPRVQAIRYNKPYTQAATLDDIVTMQEKGNSFRTGEGGGRSRIGTKRTDHGSHTSASRKRAKSGASRAAGSGGVIHSARSSTIAVEALSDVFISSTFFVALDTSLSSTERLVERDKLVTLIRKHGGFVHATLMSGSSAKLESRNTEHHSLHMSASDQSKTDFVIANKLCGFQLLNIVKQDKHDILKPSWINSCLETGRILDYTQDPDLYLHLCENTRVLQGRHNDVYGDSFTVPISDSAELRKYMERARNMLDGGESKLAGSLQVSDDYQDYNELIMRPGLWPQTAKRRLEVDEYEMLVTGLPSTIFAGCTVADFSRDGKCTAAKYKMRAHGAQVCNGKPEEAVLDVDTTHALVDLSNAECCRELREHLAERRRSGKKEVRIVTSRWVDDCISDGSYIVPRADGQQAPKAILPS